MVYLFLISLRTLSICSDLSQQRFITKVGLTWGWVESKAVSAGGILSGLGVQWTSAAAEREGLGDKRNS